jgi:hypothetical protein
MSSSRRSPGAVTTATFRPPSSRDAKSTSPAMAAGLCA